MNNVGVGAGESDHHIAATCCECGRAFCKMIITVAALFCAAPKVVSHNICVSFCAKGDLISRRPDHLLLSAPILGLALWTEAAFVRPLLPWVRNCIVRSDCHL